MKNHVTLEQWQALIAVVEEGGYANAAEALNKSQSAVSYAIQKLEAQLALKAFELVGRRAELTSVGKTLYKRAKHLLEDALQLEDAGKKLAAGVEAMVTVATDTLFPTDRLLAAIEAASAAFPATQFTVLESTLSGPSEALLTGEADLAITAYPPPGVLGEPIGGIELIAVAASHHPLHRLEHELSWEQLKKHRQVVVRDSGQKHNRDSGWLGAEQRLTVTQGSTAISAIEAGMAFAWVPQHFISQRNPPILKPLPLTQGQKREIPLLLLYADQGYAGPATRALAAGLSKCL